MITGSTGIGKSCVATALGNQARIGVQGSLLQQQRAVLQIKMAKADGSYLKEIARIEKHDLLILDDLGLLTLDYYSRATLMEIGEDWSICPACPIGIPVQVNFLLTIKAI